MAAVSLSDKLQNGKQYTFRFQTGRIVPLRGIVLRASDIATHLERAYSFLAGVKVSRGLTSSLYAVSFTWAGVPTNAGDVAGHMVQILSSDADFSFVDAEGGAVSEPLLGSSKSGDNLITRLPSITTIVIILAAVIVLAIFAGSFGKGLAGRL